MKLSTEEDREHAAPQPGAKLILFVIPGMEVVPSTVGLILLHTKITPNKFTELAALGGKKVEFLLVKGQFPVLSG